MKVIDEARKHLGTPYKFAGRGPKVYDCVGLMWRVFRDAGRPDLVDNAWTVSSLKALYHARAISVTDDRLAKPGDILVFGKNLHVALSIGNHQNIGAMTPGVMVVGNGQVLNDDGSHMPITAILPTHIWDQEQGQTPDPLPDPVPPPVTQRLYRVRARDNLHKIAVAELGSSRRWGEIYDLNRGTIGADPAKLRIGQTLVLPPK
jgi:nucleoid-associated protein YgaU